MTDGRLSDLHGAGTAIGAVVARFAVPAGRRTPDKAVRRENRSITGWNGRVLSELPAAVHGLRVERRARTGH
jgi:hypothetical protein